MAVQVRRSVISLASVLSFLLGLVLVSVPPAAALPPAAPGETWSAQTAVPESGWSAVAFGNGIFVAVTNSGANRVMTSPDGVTWTARTAAENNSWVSVTYGAGTFVAVSSNGTNQVMTSPDGVTWTARSEAGAIPWKAVTYGNGVFVAVATSETNAVMTSTDGQTWTARAAKSGSWKAVTYGNGRFVAVASYADVNRVMTSPDGVTWTARSASEANVWYSVVYGNGLFVAVSINGTNRVMTSPDGETWTARAAAEANSWAAVTYGSGVFVAISFGGTNRVMTSPDGETWTARAANPSTNQWYAVTYGNGLFVSVALSGTNQVMTSGTLLYAPAAPTSLEATAGDGSASIEFTAGDDGGAEITKYQYTTNDGSSWSDAVAGTSSPVSITGLTNGTTYSVKLRAFNSVGGGAASSAVSVTPAALFSTPSAPTSLVATAGDGSASIAFTAGADGGAEITKYQYKVGTGAWTDAVGTTSPITITGLTNYQTAKIRLRAVNSAGDGVASATVRVWPLSASSSLTSVKAQSATRIRASFAALSPVGGVESHYWVYAYAKDTDTVVSSCRSSAVARSCVIKLLTAGTEYDVAVRGFLTLTGSPTVLPTLDGPRLTVRTKVAVG